MMKLKNETVSVAGMHPDVWEPLFKLDRAHREWHGDELTLTSCRDGKHSSTSDHYWGGAVDMRTWAKGDPGTQLSGLARERLFENVQTLMGDNWYCLDEGDHFHLSYRPRRNDG